MKSPSPKYEVLINQSGKMLRTITFETIDSALDEWERQVNLPDMISCYCNQRTNRRTTRLRSYERQ